MTISHAIMVECYVEAHEIWKKAVGEIIGDGETSPPYLLLSANVIAMLTPLALELYKRR